MTEVATTDVTVVTIDEETMLRAWRGIGRFEPRAELSSWC
jgi:hypothetical protein